MSHYTQVDTLFKQPLAIARSYLLPFALHTTYKQMQASMFYSSAMVLLPPDYQNWVSDARFYLQFVTDKITF